MGQVINILLVDDEVSVLRSVSLVLTLFGHHVETATDGFEALKRVKAHKVDLLITDNNMPGLSGIDLVRQLRTLDFAGKILVLSAHLSRENRDAYEALGVDAMLQKPFDIHDLRTEVSQLASQVNPDN